MASLRRFLLLGALALLVGGAVFFGLRQAQSKTSWPPKLSLQAQLDAVGGAPPALADLHRRAGEVNTGGVGALNAQLTALRGRPVVVVLWASWCGPCQAEAVLFQHAIVKYGKRVAFVGVNSGDAEARAAKFLRGTPVAYPSFFDPDETEAKRLKLRGFPATIFLDSRGKQVELHQGLFPTLASLEEEIQRLS